LTFFCVKSTDVSNQSFSGISQLLALTAHRLGLIESPLVSEIDHVAADKLSPHGGVLWGTNARQSSQRARELLGWCPNGRSLESDIPDTVEEEAKRLGKLYI
jgi:nucleoside-diphosphate-sugar epimerase